MGGAGGTSGAVSFPGYIEDTHGWLLAGVGINTESNYNSGAETPNLSVVEMFNTLVAATSPYETFTFTNPTTELANNKAQFDLYYSAGTNRLDKAKYTNYITEAIKAVTQPTTGQIPDLSVPAVISSPSTAVQLFTGFATNTRAEITKFLSSAHGAIQTDVEALLASAASTALGETTLTAATTLWKSLLSNATSQLNDCDFPNKASAAKVIQLASNNAAGQLKEALRIVRDIVNGSIVDDIVQAFRERRELDHERQISQFAGTMADLNAVNSSAFLFGSALLRSEQMREVSEFDSQINYQVLQQGLSGYIQMHSAKLSSVTNIELENSRAHNALLEASINLLSVLHQRDEIRPTDLMQLYSGLFASELSAYSGLSQQALGNMNSLYGQNTQRYGLDLDADRINKIAKEQRYQAGLQQVLGIITNRVEFERVATSLLTEQNRIKLVARREYEGGNLDKDIRNDLWHLDVADRTANILAAPGGMARALPEKPSVLQSAVGGALQGAAAGAMVGGPVGAGIGAVVGGLGQLL